MEVVGVLVGFFVRLKTAYAMRMSDRRSDVCASDLAPREILERVRRLQDICARHGVALPTAALQFPAAHPAVATVLLDRKSVGKGKSGSVSVVLGARRILKKETTTY